MVVFVFVLALLLAIAGGGGLVAGYSLLPIEAGITYATCGAIALSTAALVAALGALIVRIDANAAKILAARPFASLGDADCRNRRTFPQSWRRNRRIGRRPKPRRQRAPEPAPAPPIPEPATRPPPPTPAPLEHASPALEAAREPPPPPRPPDLTPFEEPTAPVAGGAEEEPVNENRAGRLPTFHEVEESLAHPEAPPKIVGRYSAGGAQYRIYSDGSIEAETDEGQFKFASMTEFKAFVAGRKG